jgi:hypothetical protein
MAPSAKPNASTKWQAIAGAVIVAVASMLIWYWQQGESASQPPVAPTTTPVTSKRPTQPSQHKLMQEGHFAIARMARRGKTESVAWPSNRPATIGNTPWTRQARVTVALDASSQAEAARCTTRAITTDHSSRFGRHSEHVSKHIVKHVRFTLANSRQC